jgi:glycosyltransferase involved in cell wall biosynthesis
MRVLVHQQAHLGHHYQYIGHLLDTLTRATPDVVVAVTPAGFKSEEFTSFLAPYQDRVSFEPVLPEASPGYPYSERLRLHKDLRTAVRRYSPDHVLVPSGDGHATAMPFYRVAGQGAVPKRIPCEVGVHFGAGRAAASTLGRLRDRVNLLNLALSGATRIHLVNLLFYEAAKSLTPAARGRFVLMPHPVTVPARLTKADARRALRIPEDGRYIGLAASLDRRKAIPEFVAAFREATRRQPNDRLLLAGWMHPDRERALRQEHADLVQQGRLVLMTGFLEPTVFQKAISALDVVCTPYPGFAGLSATLLEGVAAGRPIITNHFGWCRAIVRRFQLGWTCDVMNHAEFSTTIEEALARSEEYVEPESTRRLLEFHKPSNFGATWVERMAGETGAVAAPPLTWSWVEESLPPDRRHLY